MNGRPGAAAAIARSTARWFATAWATSMPSSKVNQAGPFNGTKKQGPVRCQRYRAGEHYEHFHFKTSTGRCAGKTYVEGPEIRGRSVHRKHHPSSPLLGTGRLYAKSRARVTA